MNNKCDPKILANLKPEMLIGAYCNGAFPMVEDGELWWYRPEMRGQLPLDDRFHVSRSLAKTIRQKKFECTINYDFEKVMHLCGKREEGTWISPEILHAYCEMHKVGLAHSVEAWHIGQVGVGDPVGGLYGLSLGGAFFAESMFHTVTNAGKVALVYFIERLKSKGFEICDIQWTTTNLERFGAYEIPSEEYLSKLNHAVSLEVEFI